MQTTHNLPFEVAPFVPGPLFKLFGIKPDADFKMFRIGTCEGLWRQRGDYYEIMAVTNSEPGNGHFKDVLEWFYNSCKRDKKSLVFLSMLNDRFATHLKEKQGFKIFKGNNLIKRF